MTARLAIALLLVLLVVAPVRAQAPIFAEDFESGTRCGWDVSRGIGYSESFAGADGAPWPEPWSAVGGSVALADLDGARARFRPNPSAYSLARLVAPVDTADVDVSFTFVFEQASTQGVGFYVRSNGGYLGVSDPPGQGYAVFVESFRSDPGIGIWKEENGVEIPLSIHFDEALGFESGVPYRVRLRVHQRDAQTTSLRARAWPLGESEPTQWQVQVEDSTPVLQGISGVIALDSWSSIACPGAIVAHTLVGDVEVTPLCNPISGLGAPGAVASSFQFAEGPLWRGDHLLLSDIAADTLWRVDPPAQLSEFRSPSGESNGLAESPSGELLTAEHANRRVSITNGEGIVSVLVDNYQGGALNSPNDLAVRSDGTIYFTDPDYGLADPDDRELAFNGLFRVPAAGPLVLEWAGDPVGNRPNGVVLSPGEDLLYVTDTETGTLLAWDVALDGSLAGMRTVATGLTIPDGMCLDRRGNIYIATWAPSVEVLAPDGVVWGAVTVPASATNCTFGGADRRTLYITTQQVLYSRTATIPGLAR